MEYAVFCAIVTDCPVMIHWLCELLKFMEHGVATPLTPELAVDNGGWSVGDPIRVMGFAPLKSSKGTQLAAFRSRAIPTVYPPVEYDPAGHGKHEVAESLEYHPTLQATICGVGGTLAQEFKDKKSSPWQS